MKIFCYTVSTYTYDDNTYMHYNFFRDSVVLIHKREHIATAEFETLIPPGMYMHACVCKLLDEC